jgi:YD repeat-containing protein
LEAMARALRADKTKRELVMAAYGTGDGVKTVDADGDGFYEEKYILAAGEVIQAFFDRNQDGIIEVEIRLEKNSPAEIITRQDALRSTKYTYNGYSRISRVRFLTKERSLTYEVIPDFLRFAPVKNTPVPAELKIRLSLVSAVKFPDESTVSRRAWALFDEPTAPREPIRKWDLSQGRKLVLHEDTDRNGAFEHTVIYSDKGFPLRGQLDEDGDGFAEITEHYENGTLVRLEYDGDRDGRPEYDERLSAEIKEWDLNGDGVIDVRERRTTNGKPHFEYTGILRGLR